MNFILPIIFFFMNTSPVIKLPDSINTVPDTSKTVYLAKQQWHTGLIIKVHDIEKKYFPQIKEFEKYNLIDIGWGDEDFYRHPVMDFELAFKALFYPTKSTLRVKGINRPIRNYVEYCDLAVKLYLSKNSFNMLCGYISNSFILDSNYKPILLNHSEGESVKFYKAKGNYHLFNTCNTWISKGLNTAGLNYFSPNIILTEQLFKAAAEYGEVIKTEDR